MPGADARARDQAAGSFKGSGMMQPAQRIQQNLLAARERKLLTWLCRRMPRWVTPDQLTALGFAGAIACFFGYALSGWDSAWLWLAVAGHAIQWFGDSLDGSLARYRRIEGMLQTNLPDGPEAVRDREPGVAGAASRLRPGASKSPAGRWGSSSITPRSTGRWRR